MVHALSTVDRTRIASTQTSLLTTKLFVPATPPHVIARSRLTDRLSEGLKHKAILISTPAGYGKTTLLSSWIAQQSLSVAWVSLNTDDNDPARFLSYLIAALQSLRVGFQIGIGESSLAVMQAPQLSSIESVLTLLINEIAAAQSEIILILDNYHTIEAQPIHEALTFLIDHLPPQMHIIIASRTEPMLPLARLRAYAQLSELHTADLRFTPDEMAEFFDRIAPQRLSPEDVARFDQITEGWAVGLQLAAAALHEQADTAQLIQSFSQHDRSLPEFLSEEVLNRQAKEVQAFLLQTSILDELTGSLCDAITGRDDGQRMLESLERANAFLMPLDHRPGWYRYHHLFAELLRAQLDRWQPDRVAESHRRARKWYQQHDRPIDAIRHALAARDFDQAANLIEPLTQSMLVQHDIDRLQAWFELLPRQLIMQRPSLALGQTWTLIFCARLEAAEQLLDELERSTAPKDLAAHSAEIAAIRSSIAARCGDTADVVDLSLKALELLPADRSFLCGLTRFNLGIGYLMKSEPRQALTAFVDSAVISEAVGNIFTAAIALNNVAYCQISFGQLHQAASTYRHALNHCERWYARHKHDLPIAGLIKIGLSEILYMWNDLATSVSELEEGRRLSQNGRHGFEQQALLAGYIMQSRITQAHGDFDGALNALNAGDRFVQQCQRHWEIIDELRAARARLHIAHQDLAAAEDWRVSTPLSLESDDDSLQTQFFASITLARLLIAQARHDSGGPKLSQAKQLLDRLLLANAATGQIGHTLEVLMVQALAQAVNRNMESAIDLLEQAILLAEPAGYIRLFIDEGQWVFELLAHILDRDLRSGTLHNEIISRHTRKLLAAFSRIDTALFAVRTEGLIEPLTAREIEILKLIAAGLSNQQIAERMILATSTIKWYINHLYAKLDTHNRTSAVARARELNLIG